MPTYLTVEEAAEIARVHPETVRVWLREGRLRGRKLGKDWRIPEEELLPHGEPPQSPQED